MNFSEFPLNKMILQSLSEAELIYATKIQIMCFNSITAGSNVIGVSKTGTGKTIAYLLPILNQLEFSKQQQPRILILVPTRELAIQVKEEAEKLCKYKNFRIKELYGGTNINIQKQELHSYGADIIIGTPGRIYDLALTGLLRLNKIKKVVVDEVDEILSLAFRPQLEQIFEMINKNVQYLMFAATLSDDVNNFISTYFNNIEKIEADTPSTPVEAIEQQVFFIENFNTKINFLKNILSDKDEYVKNLIFVSNKKHADYIYEQLLADNFDKINVIHSNKSQNYRKRVIDEFENNKISSLIATDIIARGLDFTDISHVINFNVPDNTADYINRIGRTARAGRSGKALLLVTDYEKDYYDLLKLNIDSQMIELSNPVNLSISNVLIEDEQSNVKSKQYLKNSSLKSGGGAFHPRSAKRMKVNSGKLKNKLAKKRK